MVCQVSFLQILLLKKSLNLPMMDALFTDLLPHYNDNIPEKLMKVSSAEQNIENSHSNIQPQTNHRRKKRESYS